MIQVLMDENLLLLLLLLKGTTAMDLIKPFSLHLVLCYVCECLYVCVSAHWDISVVCVRARVCGAVCVNISKGMRDIREYARNTNLP